LHYTGVVHYDSDICIQEKSVKKYNNGTTSSIKICHAASTSRADVITYMLQQQSLLVHGQVTIIFVVSVGLYVCLFVGLSRVFLSRL